MHDILRFSGAVLAFASACLAQTYSECNPLFKTDCPADTALGTTATFNWTQTQADSSVWNTTNGVVNFATDGAEFSIASADQSPTIQSLFYIFWGRVSFLMKAAPGQGIVSSVVLISDDLDEIDWEWIGGNTSFVQSTWYGKGDTSTYDRAAWHPVDNTLALHNYTTVWTQEVMEWHIDGVMVRNITFDNPLAQSIYSNSTPGDRYPQTPMTVKIGNWPGGDSASNGTSEWAGGRVDYSKGPFVQVINSIEVEDYSTGSKYTYGNMSGDWQSIKIATGNSTIANILAKPHGITQRWTTLPQGVRIGIIAGAIAGAVISALALTICCIKSRRAGRKEKAIADAEWERQLTELQRYKHTMAAEEEIHPRAGYI